VEKYLKACLQEHDIPIVRTHNLVVLLDALVPVFPYWEAMRQTLRELSEFAVEVRYPGGGPIDKEIAKHAIRLCKEVREQVRKSLDLLD
jgi:HEPN domain-containing protein